MHHHHCSLAREGRDKGCFRGSGTEGGAEKAPLGLGSAAPWWVGLPAAQGLGLGVCEMGAGSQSRQGGGIATLGHVLDFSIGKTFSCFKKTSLVLPLGRQQMPDLATGALKTCLLLSHVTF